MPAPIPRRFRLLKRLPFDVQAADRRSYSLRVYTEEEFPQRIILLGRDGADRRWLVHLFPCTHYPVWQLMLYERWIEVERAWRIRLFEELVRAGRAEEVLE